MTKMRVALPEVENWWAALSEADQIRVVQMMMYDSQELSCLKYLGAAARPRNWRYEAYDYAQKKEKGVE